MKNLFLLLVITILTISSCSKDDAPAVNPATQACFSEAYNGTYIGQSGSFPLDGDITVKLTKTGCETCTFESSVMGNITVTTLLASSGGGYAGKLADGTGIAIALNGTQLSVQSASYVFGGTKQ